MEEIKSGEDLLLHAHSPVFRGIWKVMSLDPISDRSPYPEQNQEQQQAIMESDKKTFAMTQVRSPERPHDEEIKATHDEVEASTQDLESPGGVKSDNSDGRVEWSWRQILATLSLCCLYVGTSTLVSICNHQRAS
jgi:hypothetical protein